MIYKLIKKFNKNIFALFLMFLGLISCYDNGYEPFVPPTGNINDIQPNTLFTTTTSADDNLSFVFRSYSTDAVSYLWDFGDGTTSTDPNPDYTYAKGGLYNVKLITISSDTLTASDSSFVAPVFVDFDFTTEDTEVSFENLSTGASSLVWAFGDENTAEWEFEDTEEDPNFSPVHVYETADTFKATLIVTNFLGSEIVVTKNITGLQLSTVPDFTFSSVGFAAKFTDASTLAVSHSWDFGDGNTSTEVNPTHIYAGEGTYEVTLTTTNEAGVPKSITKGVPIGGVEATFPAVIANGTIDEWVPDEYHKDDNNDAWETDPPNTFKNGQTSPYLWDNKGLRDNLGLKAAGITTSKNSGAYALKFSGSDRRAYQPFTVEVGVEYTISMFVRTETGDDFNVYMLNNEVQDETDLAGNSDKVYTVSGNPNSYVEHTFTFTASSTTAVFYAVPFSGINGDSEVYLDDISIETPGFSGGEPIGVDPTFKVIVQNSTCNDHTVETGDNADSWDMTPYSTVVDDVLGTIDSPYKALWYNSELNAYIDATYCTSEQPGSTGDGNKFGPLAGGGRGVKLGNTCRRLYQLVEVEPGVEYTFTIDTRSEAEGINTEVFILNNEITTEVGIEDNSDAYFNITNDFNSSKSSSDNDTFTTTTFTFKASSTIAVIYVRALNAVDSSNEVFMDNIDIITPGF